MMTRLERLLLVCVVFFVAVRAPFSDESLTYVCIIIEFDVSGTAINFACTDFWNPYLVQINAEIRVFIADIDSDPSLSQYWPPSTYVCCGSCSKTDFSTTD